MKRQRIKKMKGTAAAALAVLAVLTVLVIGCASGPQRSSYKAGPAVYTLQLLHFADIDGNEEIALAAVDEFSALVDGFSKDPVYGASTLVVSSGDNIIPGPRFYAAEQKLVRAITGSNEPGHADIAFMNALGVKASALGNHDLDAGPGELADAMSAESKNGVEFPGALFPYLSANTDFSKNKDTAELMGTDGACVKELAGKFAASAVVEVNGEKIGLVGASTPTLPAITSTGGLVISPTAEDWTAADLAAAIQPAVDNLAAAGINKIIVLAHMQQISVEKELARYLYDVDIIVAGGSNTRMGDSTDVLFSGDDGWDETYPYETMDASGMPLLIVNVDGDYKYLGRLVVGFDADGVIVRKSLDKKLNGSWAAVPENVALTGGKVNEDIVKVQKGIQDVITKQYSNVLGFTSVYLDGRRGSVRTMQTNLGSLTADANLWYANVMGQEPVDISIKNGGGIRTEIGSAVVPPGSVDYSEAVLSPPAANKEIGTPEGAVTEGHLRATLRFDNGLVTMNATAQELVMLMEHAVAATEPGATPGQFPQLAGMKLSFDASAAPGSRITSLEVLNADGSVRDTVVSGGTLQGDPGRVFRFVTLNFLANGGDSYPFDKLSNPDRRNLYEGKGWGEKIDYPDENLAADPGKNSAFSKTGGEQDALAEYLIAMYPTPDKAFDKATDQPYKRITY